MTSKTLSNINRRAAIRRVLQEAPWLTMADAARLLDCNPETVRRVALGLKRRPATPPWEALERVDWAGAMRLQ